MSRLAPSIASSSAAGVVLLVLLELASLSKFCCGFESLPLLRDNLVPRRPKGGEEAGSSVVSAMVLAALDGSGAGDLERGMSVLLLDFVVARWLSGGLDAPYERWTVSLSGDAFSDENDEELFCCKMGSSRSSSMGKL